MIATAKRLRAEIDMHAAGIAFLDFNVAGAAEAMQALGCQEGIVR